MTEANMTGCFIVAQDPTIKEVGATKVGNISLMLVESVGKAEAKKELFSYLDCEVWDKAAEYVENHCRKGDTFIVLSSTPRQNKWEVDGKKMSKIIFRIKSFKVIPKKEQEQTAE